MHVTVPPKLIGPNSLSWTHPLSEQSAKMTFDFCMLTPVSSHRGKADREMDIERLFVSQSSRTACAAATSLVEIRS